MVYGGSGESDTQTWSCKDGLSQDPNSFVFTDDTAVNCMANADKSKAQFNNENGFFVSHFMRSFKTMDA